MVLGAALGLMPGYDDGVMQQMYTGSCGQGLVMLCTITQVPMVQLKIPTHCLITNQGLLINTYALCEMFSSQT